MASPSAQGPLTPEQLQAILNGPALAPPPDVEPNFVDPYSLKNTFIAVATVYTCILGWALFCALGGTSSMFTYYHGGTHQWNVQVKDMLEIGFWLNASAICYGLAFLTVKLSILTQYRRIFVPVKKTDFMYWSTWALSAVIFLFYGVITFFEIFLCNPRETAWNPMIPGQCFNSNTINIFTGSFNIATDFTLLLMPQYSVWKLNLPLRKRMAIASVFLIGLFACTSSCMRLYYSVRLLQSPDIAFTAMQFGLWTYAELTSALICACLPVIPRFVQKVLQGSSFYDKISSTLYGLIRSGFSGSRSYSTSQAYGRSLEVPRRPRKTSDSEHGLKISSETLPEFEMDDRSYTRLRDHGTGIVKTVDIHTSTKADYSLEARKEQKAW
ncbi:hypothetical protein MMC18_003917 [Xylographa bjoerkii]|nr:hypothetical protein [Xylographa bjoerkii]